MYEIRTSMSSPAGHRLMIPSDSSHIAITSLSRLDTETFISRSLPLQSLDMVSERCSDRTVGLAALAVSLQGEPGEGVTVDAMDRVLAIRRGLCPMVWARITFTGEAQPLGDSKAACTLVLCVIQWLGSSCFLCSHSPVRKTSPVAG